MIGPPEGKGPAGLKPATGSRQPGLMHELVPRLLMGLLGVALIAGAVPWHRSPWRQHLAREEVDRVLGVAGSTASPHPALEVTTPTPLENRVRNQVMLTRFIGASFAAVGMIMLLRPPSVTSQSRPDSERSPYWLPPSRTPASAFSTP